MNNTAPIGIFDSGLGGLTVLKTLKKMLPNESFIYFGDTAHVPYGSKSPDTIIKYSEHIIDFFLNHNTKAIIIACNTASSVAYNKLKDKYTIPLFDVVSPSVKYTINQSKTKNVGVIGTISTINSKAYSKQFYNKNSNFCIYEIACPLFVPIIEEGWQNTQIAKDTAKIYLSNFNNKNIDTLILGCTHYPIMSNTIKSIIPYDIKMIFSGETLGYILSNFLNNKSLLNQSNNAPKIQYYVSDLPNKFDILGSQFLGEKLTNIKKISIL